MATEFSGDWMRDVMPQDVFLACSVDQGGNVVNACVLLGVAMIRCNAHQLKSVTVWALRISGSVKNCKNPERQKLMKRLAAVTWVFSLSTVNTA